MPPAATHPGTIQSLDATLRRLAATRDEALWRRLLAAQAPALGQVAYGILGQRQLADDAVQEACLDLTRALARYRPGSDAAAAAWLRQIVRNKALEIRRREHTRQQHETRAQYCRAESKHEDLDAWTRTQLRAALAALGDCHRRAVELRYYQRQDHASIARQLGISPAAARKRVERGLRALRRQLRKRGVRYQLPALSLLLEGRPAPAPAPVGVVLPPFAGALAAAGIAALAGTALLFAAVRIGSDSHVAPRASAVGAADTQTSLAAFVAAFQSRHPDWRERAAGLAERSWQPIGAVALVDGEARTLLANRADAWQRCAVVSRGPAVDLDRTALLLVAEVETVVRDGYARFGLGYCGGTAPYPEGIMHRLGLAEAPAAGAGRERSYTPLDPSASIHAPQLFQVAVAFEPDGVRLFCNGRSDRLDAAPRQGWRSAHPALSFDARRLSESVPARVRRLRILTAPVSTRDDAF